MPTVLRVGAYRFFDRDEPMHIHVERDDRIAKFWLDPGRPSGESQISFRKWLKQRESRLTSKSSGRQILRR